MPKFDALDLEENVGLGMGLSTAVAIGVLAFVSLNGVASDLDKQIGVQGLVVANAIQTQKDYLGQQVPICQNALVESMKAKPDTDAALFSSTVDKMAVCGKTAQLIAVTYFNKQSDIKAAQDTEANLRDKRGRLYGDNIIPLALVDIVGSALVGKFAGFVTFCIACSIEDKNKAKKTSNEPDGLVKNRRQSSRHWQRYQ